MPKNKNIHLRSRKPVLNWVFLAFILCVMPWLISCIYIPPVWDVNDKIYRIDSIKPGVTTKSDVIDKFGLPNKQAPWGNSVQYIYSGTKSSGIFLYITPPSGGSLEKKEGWKIVIRFDKNDVVSSVSTISYARGARGGVPNTLDIGKQAGVYCPNADLGHTDAQLYIGDIYYHGTFGQKVNRIRAWVWYSLAANGGDAKAVEKLAQVTAELNAGQLEESKRQLADWKPGQCMENLGKDESEWFDWQ